MCRISYLFRVDHNSSERIRLSVVKILVDIFGKISTGAQQVDEIVFACRLTCKLTHDLFTLTSLPFHLLVRRKENYFRTWNLCISRKFSNRKYWKAFGEATPEITCAFNQNISARISAFGGVICSNGNCIGAKFSTLLCKHIPVRRAKPFALAGVHSVPPVQAAFANK